MWLNLAASRSSGADRERSVATRDRVAEQMTSADLSEAQCRAREWHAAPGSLTGVDVVSPEADPGPRLALCPVPA